MKLESVVKHGESNLHKKCAAVVLGKSKTVLKTEAAKIVRTMNKENLQKMTILFNTAHALAVKTLPFTDFKWMCKLQTRLKLGILMLILQKVKLLYPLYH